jgi:hypothetical protein
MPNRSTAITRRRFHAIAAAAATGSLGLPRPAWAGPARPTPLHFKPADPDAERLPVLGICEWQVEAYGRMNREQLDRAPDEYYDAAFIDRGIEAQLDAGIDHLVWACGRGTVGYRSDLPGTTVLGTLTTEMDGRSYDFLPAIFKQCCPLRRAIKLCRPRGVQVLGRLGMNRVYANERRRLVCSEFTAEHPELLERGKRGGVIHSRMCYASPKVQQERLDILLEVQRIGVDALVLDFCRQMPLINYHPLVVEPYREKYGEDPRKNDSPRPEDHQRWFQYRADIATGFMRRLREEVRRQEKQLGRPCPIIARVPNSAPWLMIAYSLDVERWAEQDLIDGTMLSPYPRCRDDMSLHSPYHIRAMHERGKMCIGGIGSRGLLSKPGDPPAADDPSQLRPVYAMARRQYDAGADAMSLYQTESVVRRPAVRPMFAKLGDKAEVRRLAQSLPKREPAVEKLMGLDWHAKPSACLQASRCGNYAL